MAARGLRFENVVQVRSATSFGTGYRIAPGLVLTAAHVVGAAGEVTVDGAGARVVWSRQDDTADATLVAMPVGDDETSTRFGAFVTTRPRRPVEAIGFPRLQRGPDLRDQEHFAGELNPGTGAVAQRYEITSTTPLPPADPTRSPWAGMSGAAVFSEGLLVGVVRQDRRPAAGARLIATPAATLLADDGFRATVCDHAGTPPVLEPVELASLLASPYPRRDPRSVASLLRADARTVAFHGRDEERARLVAWCETPDPVCALIVTGQGGTGKTRLAHWLVDRQREHGWTTGIVAPGASAVDLAGVRGPLLLAVDYAENRGPFVGEVLRQALEAAGPVRILLLARDLGAWSDGAREPDARVRDLLADAATLRLGALATGPDDWDAAFQEATRDLAGALSVGHQPAVPDATTHERPETALGIQMTALTMLLEGAAPAEPVERTLLRHEEAYWTQSAAQFGLDTLDPRTRREAVAALWLTTPETPDDGVAMLQRIGVRDTDRGRLAARWLSGLYPSDGDGWGALEPDRLAEYLLAAVCAEESDLLARLVTGAPDGAQMLTLLRSVRAARSQLSFGNPVDDLLAQIERTAGLPVISDETLAWAVTNALALPGAGRRRDLTELADGTRRITTELDRAVSALTVVGHQRRADGLTRENPQQAAYGYLLLSIAQDQLGRPADAADALRESVALHPMPAPLDLLIQHLIQLGRLPEAVAYADQEIALLREPEALGRAFGRKGELLLDLGDAPGALAALAEAAVIFDGLPDHAPDRAKVLAARAHGLEQTDDVPAALAAWLDAVAIWRTRSEDRSRLAQCLNNAAVCHIKLGDLPAALAAQQEAAEVATSLREERPDLYATMQANLVRYQANVDPALAVATARTLTGPLPTQMGWDLYKAAEALGTQGQFADAVEACELALRAAGDDVLLRAAAYKEMSADLADLGRYAEGAEAAAAGVAAWREALAHPGPGDLGLHTNLVTTMSNQAANLRAAGRFAEAAAVYAETAAELRPLAGEPELRALLADVLDGEARTREDAGDPIAAVPVLREAADVRRADADGGQDQGMALARALLAQSRVLLRLRRLDEAYPIATEAVDTCHRLFGDQPPRYVPEYGSAFFLMGTCLVYAGHPVEAVGPLLRAAGMAAAADDFTSADSSMSALHVAHSQNPDAVEAEWHRLTGFPFPA